MIMLFWCRAHANIVAPFDGLQRDFARQVSIKPGERRDAEDSPVDHGKQSRGTQKPLEIAQLPGRDTAVTLEHGMSRFNRPSAHISHESLEGQRLAPNSTEVIRGFNALIGKRFLYVNGDHLDFGKLVAAPICTVDEVAPVYTVLPAARHALAGDPFAAVWTPVWQAFWTIHPS